MPEADGQRTKITAHHENQRNLRFRQPPSYPRRRVSSKKLKIIAHHKNHKNHSSKNTPVQNHEINFRRNNTYASGNTTTIIPTKNAKSHTSDASIVSVANALLRLTAGANGMKFEIVCAHDGNTSNG